MGVNIPIGFGQWTMPMTLAGDTQPMVITCGFTDDGVSTPNAIANVITDAFLAGSNFAASSFPVQYTLGPGEVVVNRALGTFAGTGSVVRAGAGAQQVLPQNCAILCTKITARGGRQGRGRFYLPPAFIAEGNVTVTGGLLEATRASIQLDLNNWLAACAAASKALVLLHGDPLVGSAPAPDNVSSFVVSTVIATQRTRLRP